MLTVANRASPHNGEVPRETSKRPYAIWIGVMEAPKGPLEVIDIAKAIPEMDFIMVGWPSDESIVTRLTTQRPPNVYYLGSVSNALKRELIEKCSVGLTTSKYEGFGWIPFELLTAHKPVLAYPLPVFKEVYGDLIIYAHTVTDFIAHLRDLYNNGFMADICEEALNDLRTRYHFGKAASNIMARTLGTSKPKSLFIFTEDAPIDSDAIAGFYVVNWTLWRNLADKGIDLHIFSEGRKFSTEYGLAGRTAYVGGNLLVFRKKIDILGRSNRSLDKLKKKILSLTLLVLEPLCYTYWYAKRRKEASSRVVIATGFSQILAAIIAKFAFRAEVACLMHDTRFYKRMSYWDSFLMRIYLLLFTYYLRYVDHIMVVSRTVLEECLSFCRHPDRLTVIWDESTI
jgi:hypothetical protein